ncbi:MAG: PD40 domain-containing protein [Sedimentisphaerales bacterium]|nr:PD40 domain-containing protein [Sedimentisphaerales bacterium]
MRKQAVIFSFVLFGILLLSGVFVYAWRSRRAEIDKYNSIERPPEISPDYSSMVIPPNIAPLNFMVQERGTSYFTKIYSAKGKPIKISSRSPKIIIGKNAWHKLLEDNKGEKLYFDIFVKKDKEGWVRFGTIANRIAGEEVDGFVVYRRMHPTHTMTRGPVGIYQRDLSSFDERAVLDNHGYVGMCLNCHSFSANRPDRVLMGVRSNTKGAKTLLLKGDEVIKIGAKFGYTAWHPSGNIAVYSINNLPMFFHTAGEEVRDTIDLDSTLAYFVAGSRTIKTTPEISRKDRLETWPAWSGDGRYLYFCSTKITWAGQEKFPPDGYDKVKYDLVRISYDVEKDKWGQVETVLSSKDTGFSIAMPRISPDGRWLVFCMCKYGYFPPWEKNSDLYIMDLKSAEESGRYEYRRLDISSDHSEGWHSWSSNSRWIVFSSKKEQGSFTRCYISYVDKMGSVHKPLVLPQKNPEFYDFCLETFNTPEFVTGPIKADAKGLMRVMNGDDEISVTIPITGATPSAETKPKTGQPWRE